MSRSHLYNSYLRSLMWLCSIVALVACAPESRRAPLRAVSTNGSAVEASIQGSSISVSVNDYGSSREDAEQRVAALAIREGLKHFMKEPDKDEDLAPEIKKWVQKLAANHYKPLVRRWLMDIDESKGGRYYLQGRLILDYENLKYRAERYLHDKRKDKTLRGRFSVYIIPDISAALSSEDLALGKSFMHALEQRLVNAGFDIKFSNQQGQAQYLLKLSEVNKNREGLIGTVEFAVQALDNRADRALFTTAYGKSAAALSEMGTSGALKTELLQRAAQKVSAELMRQFIASKDVTEIVFYAPPGTSKRRVVPVLEEGLADLYGMAQSDDVIDTFVNDLTLQDTKEADGSYLFSFEVPNRYRSSKKRFEKALLALQTRAFGTNYPEIKLAKAGQKWLVFDDTNRPATLKLAAVSNFWGKKVEQLIREGKLDAPAGSGFNAYDTIQAHLKEQPGDPVAFELLHKISTIYSKKAFDYLLGKQPRQAVRYLKRAERIWPENPDIADIREQLKSKTFIPSEFASPRVIAKTNSLPTSSPDEGRAVLKQGRNWALLIGNQKYEHVNLLNTPHNDIDDLSKVLEQSYRFDSTNMTVLKDGTREQILNAINSMKYKVDKNDSLLIYYAGHGDQESGAQGLGYWIPIDGRSPESKGEHISSWISNSDVRNAINVSKAKHVLLISDSCYSGTFKTTAKNKLRSLQPDTDLFLRLAAQTSRHAITSGDITLVADAIKTIDPNHSPFAHYLISELKKNKDRIFSAEYLFLKIREPVINIDSDQSQYPQYFVIDTNKDKGGDFVFTPVGLGY